MMERREGKIIGLLIILVALATSHVDQRNKTSETSVWVGDSVDLECADNSDSSNYTRVWKMGGESESHKEGRVSMVNDLAILRLVNVTVSDSGLYKCVVNPPGSFPKPVYTHTIKLQVKEMPCKAPDKPVNGGYKSGKLVDKQMYKIGDVIQYYCSGGYDLIGVTNRTCTGTPKGWSSDEPHCEPKYVAELRRRLNVIEDKIKTIEERLTKVDSISGIVKNIVGNVQPHVGSSTDTNKQCLMSCTKDSYPTMQLDVRNGHNVSEFEWVVEDIESKVPDTEFTPLDSTPFYHTVPGYKFKLRAYIWPDGDINIRLILMSSEYDDDLVWPITLDHELFVILNDGNEVLHRNCSGPSVDQPMFDTSFKCYTVSPDWLNIWKNKLHVLKDGSVVIKVYIYNE